VHPAGNDARTPDVLTATSVAGRCRTQRWTVRDRSRPYPRSDTL